MSHPFILNGLMLLRKLRLTKLAMKARTARAAGAQASDRRRWLKRLDRYIIKKFLGTYLFSIVLLLAIVVVFDVNEKLDAMMKAPLYDTIFVYFWNFLPYFANQFSPLFTFIAVIFYSHIISFRTSRYRPPEDGGVAIFVVAISTTFVGLRFWLRLCSAVHFHPRPNFFY